MDVTTNEQGILFNLINAFDQVSGTGDFHLTMTDLVANTFVGTTPQAVLPNNIFSASLGTSVVRSPSFRDASGTLRLFPGEGLGMNESLNPHLNANIFTDNGGKRYESVITGEFVSNGMVDIGELTFLFVEGFSHRSLGQRPRKKGACVNTRTCLRPLHDLATKSRPRISTLAARK